MEPLTFYALWASAIGLGLSIGFLVWKVAGNYRRYDHYHVIQWDPYYDVVYKEHTYVIDEHRFKILEC